MTPVSELIASPVKLDMKPEFVQVLYFHVFMGLEAQQQSRKAFCRMTGMTMERLRQIQRNLLQRRWLSYSYRSYSWDEDLIVERSSFLNLAFDMLKYHREEYDLYDPNIRYLRTSGAASLWSLVHAMYTGDGKKVDKLARSEELSGILASYVGPFISLQVFEPLVIALPAIQFQGCVINSIEDDLYRELLDAGTLDQYERLIRLREGDLDRSRTDDMLNMVSLHRYYCLGQPYVNHGKKLVWALCAEAVSHLYAGRVEPAIESFSGALKLRNKDVKDKNVFHNIITCFFLILAYKKADTPETRKKVDQFVRKNITEADPGMGPARLAAQYINTGTDTNHLSFYIRNMVSRLGARAIGFRFASMLISFLDVDRKECGLDIKALDDPSSIAILRHEQSAWLDVPDEESLATAFGGGPVLASIGSRKAWEIAIDDVLSICNTSSSKGNVGDVRTKRYIYVLRGYGEIEIREQKVLKSGGWSAGMAISINRFKEETEGKDELDQKIAAALADNYTSRCDATDILPFLVGSDRVYYGRFAPLKPVTVKEERPCLTVRKGKGGWEVSTNIEYDYRKRPVQILKYSDTEFSVMRVTALQRKVIERIKEIKSFPLAAESRLRSFLEKLSDLFEIRSTLFDSGSSLEKIQCESVVTVRVTPSKSGFSVCPVVHPLPDCQSFFFPGEGEKAPVLDAGGKRYIAVRNLLAESAIAKELENFVSVNLGIDFFNSAGQVFQPEELLTLLEFIEGDSRYAVEWPEGHELKIRAKLDASSVHASLHSKENWFEVEGDIDLGDGSTLDLHSLFTLLGGKSSQKYVRLSDSEYLEFSESLRKQLERLESLVISGKGKDRISTFRIGPLAELVSGSSLMIDTDEGFKTLSGRIQEAANYKPEIPAGLKADLRDYQEDGFKWISQLDRWGAGACLADDMGLGKTVQAIAFMLSKAEKGPSLVVAPASVVPGWVREISRFAPGMGIFDLYSADNRQEVVGSTGAGDVVLCSYGLLVSESELLSGKKWNVVCLDEAHVIKNRETKTSAAVMSLESASRLILTGTPVQNHLGELWNLFQFLNPGLLGTFEQFRSKYIQTVDSGDGDRRQQLKRIVRPFLLRRTKEEVIEELPEKTEIVRQVRLSTEELAVYEVMREKARQALAGENKVTVNALAQLTLLREASCSISLVDQRWNGPESKLTAFSDLVSEIVESGNKVLVFSQFTSFLSICKASLEEAGISFFCLEGKTPVPQREKIVRSFQAGERPVFLISLKAGGLGLNLTGANYVIHLDPWWNPAIEQQATDRAYRIGQSRNVTVYHLVSGNTIEEKILRLHKSKRDLADAILEGSGTSHSLTLEELKALLA